ARLYLGACARVVTDRTLTLRSTSRGKRAEYATQVPALRTPSAKVLANKLLDRGERISGAAMVRRRRLVRAPRTFLCLRRRLFRDHHRPKDLVAGMRVA